jgi:hypothetical protein
MNAKLLILKLLFIMLLLLLFTRGHSQVPLASPGLAPSQMDSQGRLVEDWGAVSVRLLGEGMPERAEIVVREVRLDNLIPGVEAQAQYGPVALTLTAFRAPAWPSGLDVLTVRVHEIAGKEARFRMALDLPESAQVASSLVRMNGRAVIALPESASADQPMRDWGYDDDSTALPGWARPERACDPAFRNIRAGMNGVPIRYHFAVASKARFNVVLGLCESHWSQPGQRPVVLKVEGAPMQEVDPLTRWGRHIPGALLFEGKDENGDGVLEVQALPRLGSPDTNPILNVIWLFPPGEGLNLDQVIAGRLNALAVRYVDVGGANDQSLYAGGRAEYAMTLPPNGVKEWTFLVASPGASVTSWEKSDWTPAKLRRAAAQVWREWKEK